MSLPIVFMHRGDDEYLAYSLSQAMWSNPSSPILLFGKPANQKFAQNGITHVMMDDYMGSAREFAKVYRHIHHMPYEYNLFCFQRWFILRDFMKVHNISKCCYLDSDVMLYTDVKNPLFDTFMMEFVWTNFVEISRLEQFCSFVTAHFENVALFGQVVSFTLKSKDHLRFGMPLVTDMVLGVMFLQRSPGYRMSHGLYHSGFFDGNVQQSLFTESAGGKKKIYVSDGQLYCKHIQTNSRLSLFSLHFQGDVMKHYMKFFYSPALPQEGTLSFDYPSCRWLPAT